MSEQISVQVTVGTEEEARALQEYLDAEVDEATDVSLEEVVDESDPNKALVPVFVWIVAMALIGVAGLAKIVVWIIGRTGCSALIWVGDDGEPKVTKNCEVRGLLILKDKDGKLTYVDRDLIDLNKLFEALVSGGAEAAKNLAKAAGAVVAKGDDGEKDDPAD